MQWRQGTPKGLLADSLEHSSADIESKQVPNATDASRKVVISPVLNPPHQKQLQTPHESPARVVKKQEHEAVLHKAQLQQKISNEYADPIQEKPMFGRLPQQSYAPSERTRSCPDDKPRVESQKKLLQLSVRKSAQVVSTSQKPESVKIPSETFSSSIVSTHQVKPSVKLINRTTTQEDMREAQAAYAWNLATRESNEAEARYLVSLDKKDYKAWEDLRHRRTKKAKAIADIRQILRKEAQKRLDAEKKGGRWNREESRCG